ncbi:MAG: hypothetical protein GXX91_10155 [Verrucomicrobiaceae bacterium]|nr:hypothetical protein [Verrucomicrobiaceae bacterium]
MILFLAGCEKPGERQVDGTTPQKGQTYPIQRTVSNNTGRTLRATILGRTATSITVLRDSDGARFVIPNTRLSAADQAFVSQLPLQSAPPASPHPSSPSPSPNSEPGVLSFRRSAMEELNDQIQKNEALLYQMDPGTIKARSLRSETNRLMDERAELAQEIAELESK